MLNTKALYASTLVLAGLAGFSSGWAARAPGAAPATEQDRILDDWARAYRITRGEEDRLREILRRLYGDLDVLRDEFDRKYGKQVEALKDRYQPEIDAILTEDKKRTR